VTFDAAIDNTASYVNRFHTVTMDLSPKTNVAGYSDCTGSPSLPLKLTPTLRATTLFWSLTPLVYGTGEGLGVGSGVPPINNFSQHFFTGRSDNFDPKHNSGDPNDAHFDSEGMRLSNDGLRVYVSDEYGPYIYEFDRLTGLRLRSFQLPASFYVSILSPVGTTEISGDKTQTPPIPANTSGRVANKGMEGLAITPDGRTLVGIMQNSLIQDGGSKGSLLRIVTIDIHSGKVTHQYGYLLTVGSGVSEIVALNEHEFLVDERDGTGRESGGVPLGASTNAKFKQLFKIDLKNAIDISGLDDGSLTLATVLGDPTYHTVQKKLFLDIVHGLNSTGIPLDHIPSKIEGVSFGPDVKVKSETLHTLWIGNDSDFIQEVLDAAGNVILNPNQFFVFGFTDSSVELGGSKFVP
jgi:Esterase-like activity of phytase